MFVYQKHQLKICSAIFCVLFFLCCKLMLLERFHLKSKKKGRTKNGFKFNIEIPTKLFTQTSDIS